MIIRATEFHRLDLQHRGCVGVTSGCFDLLHFYHVQYLEKCRALCDFLIVGVDDDGMIQMNKGKTPIIGQHQRTMMVEALRCVDAVWTMTSLEELHFLAARAHAVFKNGPNVYGTPIRSAFKDKLVVIPDIEEITSTTAIISRIRTGGKDAQVAAAAAELHAFLDQNVGNNAEWPIKLNVDNQADADHLCRLLNTLKTALKK